MEQIVLRHVSSVYSGTHGCACGCRGTHTYASQHREWASKHRGYDVTDEDVNDNRVKRFVNKMNKMLANGVQPEFPGATNDFISIKTSTRQYVVYYKITDIK